MRQSKFFMPTLKEAPSDAVAESHKLMIRGGYIRQVTAGVYAYLPLGYRVLRKAEGIIEQEMDKINVPEMIMPHLLPATLWQESGRYKKYGAEMFKLKDRHGRESLLGPTHEETFTEIIAKNLKSYKQMPLALYQIQTKFRDENRPRFGLLRGREFVMLDGYSFAATRDQLDEQFDDQKNAYKRIFKRAGVTVHPVIVQLEVKTLLNFKPLLLSVRIQLLLMKKEHMLPTLKWLRVLILSSKNQKMLSN